MDLEIGVLKIRFDREGIFEKKLKGPLKIAGFMLDGIDHSRRGETVFDKIPLVALKTE